MVGFLSSFFPPVLSFSPLGPGNCKKRIALESIILLVTLTLFYEQILTLGIFCIAVPGYLVNGTAWFDLCSTDP